MPGCVCLGYGAALWALAGLTLACDRVIAGQAGLRGPALGSVYYVGKHVQWSIWIVGSFVSPGRDGWGFQAAAPWLEEITAAWGVVVGAVFSGFFMRSGGSHKSKVALLLGLVLVASTPALFQARGNLVLLPTLFFCAAFGVTVTHYWLFEPVLEDRRCSLA